MMAPKIGRCKTPDRLIELRMVEHIVAFHPKFKIATVITRHQEVLRNDEIDVIDSGGVVLVPADVSEGSYRFVDETGGRPWKKARSFEVGGSIA